MIRASAFALRGYCGQAACMKAVSHDIYVVAGFVRRRDYIFQACKLEFHKAAIFLRRLHEFYPRERSQSPLYLVARKQML